MKLFEPIMIGKMEVPNRFVAAPVCSRLANEDGYVTRRLIDYWSRRAAGGAGLIIVEAAHIDRHASRAERNELGIYSNECHTGLAELAEAIQMYGSKACLQLIHAGRQTTSLANWGNTPIAPSPIPCKYMSEVLGRINKTREITLAEIEQKIEEFAEGVKRAKEAGFDAVEVHGGHGYLIASFLSGYTNKRTDWYGGPLENRARFALEIVERIREKVGSNYPVLFRISAEEFIEGGITLAESKIFAKMLEDASVDCVHVSASNYETAETQCPPMYLPYGYLINLAEEIKKVVSVPVIAVGSITAELSIKIIEEGKADLVAIARGLIADPDLPNKVAENRLEDVRPCIRCNEGCLVGEASEKLIRCDVNFIAGRESYFDLRPATKPLKVHIIGGGPGGMEAARIAAIRGHNVTLSEASDKLGGNLIPASVPSFKEDIKRLNDYLITQIKKLGVKVEIGRKVTPNDIKIEKPDVAIVAIGSKPVIPDVKGTAKPIVINPVDLLMKKTKIGQNILIIGGGFIGCEVAAYLGQQKKKVTLTTRRTEKELAGEIEYFAKKVLRNMLKEYKVEIKTQSTLAEVLDDGAVFLDKNGSKFTLKADNIIISGGFVPKTDEVKHFKKLAPSIKVYAIGDCVKVRRIGSAIHEGFFVAYNL